MLLKLDGPPPPPTQWLLDGILPAFGISVLASQPGMGKTVLAANIAVAVASGAMVLDRPVQQGGVIFVTAESQDTTHRRLALLGGSRLPIVIAHGNVNLLDDNAAEVMTATIRQAGVLLEQPVRLVVIDALGSACRGMDENSAKDVSRAMGALVTATEATGAAVLLLAHVAKNGTTSRVRGHSSIEADVEVSLAIEIHEGCKTLVAVKNRHLPDFDPIPFRLKGEGEAVRVVVAEPLPVTVSIEERRKTAVLEYVRDHGGTAPRIDVATHMRGSGLLPDGKSGDERLREAVVALEAEGAVTRAHDGKTLHLPPPN